MNENYVRRGTIDTDGPIMLLEAMITGSADGAVAASEKRGQQQLVASSVIPTEMDDRAAFEALGFVFGEVVEGDDLFTDCTLPDGWSKQGSDHDMWSYVHDQLGRRRVAVFFKSSFYDRRAFCRLETAYGYLSSALYEKREPVLDDVWLTPEHAVATLNDIAARCDESAVSARTCMKRDGNRDDYWVGRIAEDEAEAATARAMRDKIAAL